MTIELGPELERIVREKVESGAYPSANDVIAAALIHLEEAELDDYNEAELEHLRKEIAVGLEDIKHGRVLDGPTVFAELRRKYDIPDGDR